MGTSIKKTGILLADGSGVGENLLIASEAYSGLISTNPIGTKSFDVQSWVATLYSKTWMNANLTQGKNYTLSYKVTCLSRPEGTFTHTETRSMPILVHQGSGWSQTTIVDSGSLTTDIPVGESRIFTTKFTFSTASESAEYYGLCAYTMLFRNDSGQQYAKFRIENLKLEEGSYATPWVPNESDDIYTGAHSFFEGYNPASIGDGYSTANEFYEY